jgi:hypothetical protein
MLVLRCENATHFLPYSSLQRALWQASENQLTVTFLTFQVTIVGSTLDRIYHAISCGESVVVSEAERLPRPCGESARIEAIALRRIRAGAVSCRPGLHWL